MSSSDGVVRSGYHSLAILLFLLPFALFTQDHLRGKLDRDSGIYIYAGQQAVQGTLPYASIFDHKGPLTSLVCAGGIVLADALGQQELFVVRAIFLAAAAGCVALVFLIGATCWRSVRAGWLSALIFLGFWGFAHFASSGPRPKTLMLLLALLCVRFGMKQRYFWAALAGGAAVMVWQPACVFLLALATALALRQPSRPRISEWLRLAAGAACVPLLVALYFAWNGALDLFWEGLVSFNVFLLERGADGDASFLSILRGIHKGYSGALLAVIGGWAALPWAVCSSRIRSAGNAPSIFSYEAGILLPLWVLVSLWTAADFQGYVDAYPLLPLSALGFGWFLDRALSSLGGSERSRLWQAVVASLALLLVAWTEIKMKRSFEVDEQRAAIASLRAELEPGDQVRSLGAPEMMALLGGRQDDRYLFVVNGIDALIEARHPGGWQGWLGALQDAPPRFILYRTPRGKKVRSLITWIESNYLTRWEAGGARILEHREAAKRR